jgi:predicted ArsR family transcriptional regulator
MLQTCRVFAHPVRVRTLIAFLTHPMCSSAELADYLDLPVQTVRYHVRQLHQAGMVDLAREVGARGAVERFYELSRATKQALVLIQIVARGMAQSSSAGDRIRETQ